VSAVVLSYATSACSRKEPRNEFGARQAVHFHLPPDSTRYYGETTARVVFIEFGSHVCGLCAEFAQRQFPVLDSLFFATGRARYRYVDLSPSGLPRQIAGVLECTAKAADYLPDTRLWFYGLNTASFGSITQAAAERTGVSQEGMRACADSVVGSSRYLAEVEAARGLRVPGTPTFIIGESSEDGRVIGWVIVGPASIDSLVQLVVDADFLLQLTLMPIGQPQSRGASSGRASP
jgi:protein-disulfide isomerase